MSTCARVQTGAESVYTCATRVYTEFFGRTQSQSEIMLRYMDTAPRASEKELFSIFRLTLYFVLYFILRLFYFIFFKL